MLFVIRNELASAAFATRRKPAEILISPTGKVDVTAPAAVESISSNRVIVPFTRPENSNDESTEPATTLLTTQSNRPASTDVPASSSKYHLILEASTAAGVALLEMRSRILIVAPPSSLLMTKPVAPEAATKVPTSNVVMAISLRSLISRLLLRSTPRRVSAIFLFVLALVLVAIFSYSISSSLILFV